MPLWCCFCEKEGCSQVVCRAMTSGDKNRKQLMRVDFEKVHNGCELYFLINNSRCGLNEICRILRIWFNSNRTHHASNVNHRKRNRAGFESRCGATLNWDMMTSIEPYLNVFRMCQIICLKFITVWKIYYLIRFSIYCVFCRKTHPPFLQ